MSNSTVPMLVAANCGKVELGSVRPSSKHFTTVTFTNTSRHHLRVDRFVSSCRCTIASGQNIRVKPGGTVEIPVQYSAGLKPGNQQAIVSALYFNEADKSRMQRSNCVISASVEPHISVMPTTTSFTKLGESRVVEVKCLTSPDVRIISVFPAVDGLTTEVERSMASLHGNARIRISLTKPIPQLTHTFVTVVTDSAWQSELRISIIVPWNSDTTSTTTTGGP